MPEHNIDKRVRILNNHEIKKGLVLYWMSRDQRAEDNFALLFAQNLAFELHRPMVVVFTLDFTYSGANMRHYSFMLNGLQLTEERLKEKNISLIVLEGNPVDRLEEFIQNNNVSALITDFDPLKIKIKWKSDLNERLKIPFFEADTHNIVPCWSASDKEEFGAYTLRPKIKRLLPQFLTNIPELNYQNENPYRDYNNNWERFLSNPSIDRSVSPSEMLKPGSENAKQMLNDFIYNKLDKYHDLKSNPNFQVTSFLSPYLHFGQISSHRIAVEIIKTSMKSESSNDFLEELIIRKELADNFCFYNSNYDTSKGFRPWAQLSLDTHSNDEREFIYSLNQFENAQTHDTLWNAAQMSMVKTGYMHGYMRMYWAKKILEWTANPTIALNTANFLNDKYSLDGRDPNGYCGTAWSIGGIHDRPWADRPVFGKIRYMNYNGCKRKFDVANYIASQL